MNISQSIICAVDMWDSKKYVHDKVNYYVLEKLVEFEKGELESSPFPNWRGARKEMVELESSDVLKMVEIGKREWSDDNKERLLGEEMVKLESPMPLPISSNSKCHSELSYIVFKSRLYRISGSYYSEEKCEAVMIHARFNQTGEKVDKPEKMYDSTRSVDILDLNNIKEGWKKGPEMNFRRRSPYPLILGGKLYVAGGITEKGFAQGAGFVNVSLMEVLEDNGNGGKWEALPNPLLPDPLLIFNGIPLCAPAAHPNPNYPTLEEEKSLPLKFLYGRVLAGAVESSGFIIVGLRIRLSDPFRVLFYTYRPNEEHPKWMTYKEVTFDDSMHIGLTLPPPLPAVVTSANLMIFLCPYARFTLYVMDLNKETLLSLDLCKQRVQDPAEIEMDDHEYSTSTSTSTSVLPPGSNLTTIPRLLMLNENEAEMEFCVFWTGYSRVSSVHDRRNLYSTLHATIFTLETHPLSNTLHVKLKSDSISLIPSILNNTNRLQAICIADVPLTPPSSA